MARVNVYLTFDGNCEAAFNFYKSVFGGEFSSLNRYKEMPPHAGLPPMPEDYLQMIMHITLPISKETVLMGSDRGGQGAPPLSFGNNFSISVDESNMEKAKKIFDSLSDGGKVTMPWNKTFWGAYFGMLKDQFGINWMVVCEEEQE